MPKVKSCKNCALCEQVYRKGGYGFYADNLFLCAVTENFTDRKSVCESWREKAVEYDISLGRFNKAKEDVSAIKQLFKEKKIHLWFLRARKRRIST